MQIYLVMPCAHVSEDPYSTTMLCTGILQGSSIDNEANGDILVLQTDFMPTYTDMYAAVSVHFDTLNWYSQFSLTRTSVIQNIHFPA